MLFPSDCLLKYVITFCICLPHTVGAADLTSGIIGKGGSKLEEFVRNRITQLRLDKGVSEYQMSYALGHSRGYIYNISSGKALPSMSEFFSICDYFGISPGAFFDTKQKNPVLMDKLMDEIKTLSDDDIILLLTLIHRLNHNAGNTP